MALRDNVGTSAVAVSDTDGMRVSWGGIWGGVLVGLGILMLLTALGLAIGATAVDPTDTEAQTIGIGAAIWAGLTLLIALYVAGHVSTRIGAIFDRTTSTYEGFLVWVVSILFMAFFAASGIGLVASGAFKLVGGATQAIGTVVSGGNLSDLSQGNVEQICSACATRRPRRCSRARPAWTSRKCSRTSRRWPTRPSRRRTTRRRPRPTCARACSR